MTARPVFQCSGPSPANLKTEWGDDIKKDSFQEEQGVLIGSIVTVQEAADQIEYLITYDRSDPDTYPLKISKETPIARALLGRRAGDIVEVRTPGGVLKLRIVGIRDEE